MQQLWKKRVILAAVITVVVDVVLAFVLLAGNSSAFRPSGPDIVNAIALVGFTFLVALLLATKVIRPPDAE